MFNAPKRKQLIELINSRISNLYKILRDIKNKGYKNLITVSKEDLDWAINKITKVIKAI